MFGIRKAIVRVVENQLPDAVVRKQNQEPIVRIQNPDLLAFAASIDKFYGDNNSAIDLTEVATFKQKLTKNEAALTELRDAQEYGSPLYQRYDGEVKFCREQLGKADSLQRHIEQVRTGLVEDFASLVSREGRSLVSDLASRVQDAAATIAGAATKHVQLGVSLSAKDGAGQ